MLPHMRSRLVAPLPRWTARPSKRKQLSMQLPNLWDLPKLLTVRLISIYDRLCRWRQCRKYPCGIDRVFGGEYDNWRANTWRRF